MVVPEPEEELSPKAKLAWLGMSNPSSKKSVIAKELELLKENFNSYQDFADSLDAYDLDNDGTDEDADSFDDFKVILADNGFSNDEPSVFVDKIKKNFDDQDSSGTVYDEFEDYVQNKSSSYEELSIRFDRNNTLSSDNLTEGGEEAAGIRAFSKPGVTFDGVEVPEGAVEIFGREIHFSQQDAAQRKDESTDIFNVGNIRTDEADDSSTVSAPIEISADVTNNSSSSQFFQATLNEDGTAVQSQMLEIPANSVQTVNFSVNKDEITCHEYKINSSGTVEACWVPAGL